MLQHNRVLQLGVDNFAVVINRSVRANVSIFQARVFANDGGPAHHAVDDGGAGLHNHVVAKR